MLTCKDVTELTTPHLERQLSPRDRLRFRLHLLMCRHCRRYVEQIQQIVRALRTLPAEPAPPPLREALVQHYRDWIREL